MFYVYPFPKPLVLWKIVMIITAAIQKKKKVLKVWDAIVMIAKYSLKYRPICTFCFLYQSQHIFWVIRNKGNINCPFSTFLTTIFASLASASWGFQNPNVNYFCQKTIQILEVVTTTQSALLPCSTAKLWRNAV